MPTLFHLGLLADHELTVLWWSTSACRATAGLVSSGALQHAWFLPSGHPLWAKLPGLPVHLSGWKSLFIKSLQYNQEVPKSTWRTDSWENNLRHRKEPKNVKVLRNIREAIVSLKQKKPTLHKRERVQNANFKKRNATKNVQNNTLYKNRPTGRQTLQMRIAKWSEF